MGKEISPCPGCWVCYTGLDPGSKLWLSFVVKKWMSSYCFWRGIVSSSEARCTSLAPLCKSQWMKPSQWQLHQLHLVDRCHWKRNKEQLYHIQCSGGWQEHSAWIPVCQVPHELWHYGRRFQSKRGYDQCSCHIHLPSVVVYEAVCIPLML